MNLRDHKNSKKQGDAGLGVAIGWFATNGKTVCVPLTDSQDYDLVVDDDGILKRVQVRTTTYKTPYGIYAVGLAVHGGNRSGQGKTKHFDPTKIDLLFVVSEDGRKYLIPTSQMSSRKQLNLGPACHRFLVE